LDDFFAFVPEYQPDGRLSTVVAAEHIKTAFAEGRVRFECMHQASDGTPIPAEVTLVRVPYEGEEVIAGYVRDLREQKKMMKEIEEGQQILRLMTDATPLCFNLWDRNGRNLQCNDEAVKLFNVGSQQEYLKRFYEFIPEYQPDGQRSTEKGTAFLHKALAEGRCVFDWTYVLLDGALLPTEVTFVRIAYQDDYVVAGYARDLREHNRMLQEIEQRDHLLNTVNQAAQTLLQSEPEHFAEDMHRCMGTIAEAIEVDRVYIWKNHMLGGRLHCTQEYEWSGGAEPQQGNEYTVDVAYDEMAPDWEETLARGKCISGRVRDMHPDTQAHLVPQGILSVFVAPIFVEDQFWGFIGYDSCRAERLFTEGEQSILRSGGIIISTPCSEMSRRSRSRMRTSAHGCSWMRPPSPAACGTRITGF